MERLFNLQEGEKIVQEIKPKSGLLWYFFLTGGDSKVAGLMIAGIFFFVYLFYKISDPVGFFSNFWLKAIGFITVFVIIDLSFSIMRYNKQHYWITNKRVIYKRGVIGYQITSIPYERISDAVISRTFMERLFGFGSLHIQSLAGQMSGKTSLGSEGVLYAIPNPEETQELIFKLVKTKRKEEGLFF